MIGRTGEGKSTQDFSMRWTVFLVTNLQQSLQESEDVLPSQEQRPTHDNEEESLPISCESSTASLQQATENTLASDRSKNTPSAVQESTRKQKKPPKSDNAIVNLQEQVVS